MRRLALLLLLACATISGAQAADPPGRKFVVFFQEWSVAIDDNAEKIIAEAAELARSMSRATITVTGFADPTGSRKSNIMLSELRAQRVVDYLGKDGVGNAQVRQRGKGPVQFAISSQESRRVEINVKP